MAVDVPLQVLVLAAGKGTRLKSAKAKVLHAAFELPLLEHVLRAARDLEPRAVTVVVGHQSERVEERFAERGLTFVRQEPQRGTGHAVQVAAPALETHAERTVLILSGDTPLLRAETLRRLVDEHVRSEAAATLLTCRLDEPGSYGRVERAADGERVLRVTEAKDASPAVLALDEINAGVYVFDVPRLLAALGHLDDHNAQGELYLTDVVERLADEGADVRAVLAEDAAEALGVNTLAELAAAGDLLRRRRLAGLMAAGVGIEDPASTTVGPDVEVAPDAWIRPFSILEGRSSVASGARVGPFVRLVDTQVGEGAEILDHCLLRDCVVGAGANVGPFAHIRPETVIGAKARVGNFVELKKTRLGDGSKAPHLSYLGDSTIGPRVNVGAGTITCNYDGTHKHPTRIEAGAFVGSNSTLVAPVTVGEGAYVAAGSVITEDVPQDALALGRARQVVKAGWASARRTRLARQKA